MFFFCRASPFVFVPRGTVSRAGVAPYTRGCGGRSPARAHDAGTSPSRANATATARRVSSNGKKCGWSQNARTSEAHNASVSRKVSRASRHTRSKSPIAKSNWESASVVDPAPRVSPAPRARRQSLPRSAAGAPPRRNARHASLVSSFQRRARSASASAVLRAANAACHASSMPACLWSGASSRRNARSSARRGGAPVGKPRARNHGTIARALRFASPRDEGFSPSFSFASSSARTDATIRRRSKWSYACPATRGNDAVNAARSKADSGASSAEAESESPPSVGLFFL